MEQLITHTLMPLMAVLVKELFIRVDTEPWYMYTQIFDGHVFLIFEFNLINYELFAAHGNDF